MRIINFGKKCLVRLERRFCRFFPRLCPYTVYLKRIIRFCISGSTAFLANLILLWFFYGLLKVDLIISTTIAVVLSFIVSFCLQKFWTFKENTRRKIPKQVLLYVGVALLNLAINNPSMLYLVNVLGVWYLLAQTIVNFLVGFINYLIYHFIIFKKQI